jgi:hypothetical protein
MIVLTKRRTMYRKMLVYVVAIGLWATAAVYSGLYDGYW